MYLKSKFTIGIMRTRVVTEKYLEAKQTVPVVQQTETIHTALQEEKIARVKKRIKLGEGRKGLERA